MDFTMIEKDVVRIKLLPVCDCGYVFIDGINVYEDVFAINDKIKSMHIYFTPTICPQCKRKIECITCDSAIAKYLIK